MRYPFIIATAATVLSTSTPSLAGDPTPPPGPVAGTMKTLDEVEPRIPISQETAPGTIEATYQITAPGSYYLTGNMVGEADKIGIWVYSPDVTIDLMGFTMTGHPLVSQAWPAIYVSSEMSNVEVRNGAIAEWTGGGVVFDESSGGIQNVRSVARDLRIRDCTGWGIIAERDTRILDCTVTDCLFGGIYATRTRSVIEGCIASDNDGPGIRCVSEAVVRNCIANQNGDSGIIVGSASTVTDSNASINLSGSGFELGAGATAENCTAAFNGIGFTLAGTNTLANCTSRLNYGAGYLDESSPGDNDGTVFSACAADKNQAEGFLLSSAARMTDCTSIDNNGPGVSAGDRLNMTSCVIDDNNDGGVAAGAGSSIAGTTVTNNTGTGVGLSLGADSAVRDCEVTGNAANGVVLGNGGILESSIISQNGGHGAVISNGTRVDGCAIRNNPDSGVYAGLYCFITNSVFDNNGDAVGEAGVRVFEGCRVEGNTFTENFRGVRMDDNRNVVVRNSFMKNGSPQLEDVNANNQNAPSPVSVTVAGPWDNITH